MKTLIWDVETSDLELAIRTYQLKNYSRYFDPKTIKRDWTMLGAAWKFKNEKAVKAISVSPQNPLDDEHVIKHLYKALSEADVLIGHNSDNFDIKKFNTRAIFYGLSPLLPKVQVDTLKIARKYFKFTSNKLSYIADYLGLDVKDESPDWEKVINGCAKELRYMRKYNKKDVVVTEQVYDRLMSWHHTHPRTKEKPKDIEGKPVNNCQKCGDPKVWSKGVKLLASGRKRRYYQCQNCCGYQSGELI